MIFRAVVCPGAPLLIPGLADGLAAEVPNLTTACDHAIGCLQGVDHILMLCSGPGVRDQWQRAQRMSVVHPAGTVLSSALLTGRSGPVHFTGRLAGARIPDAVAGPRVAGAVGVPPGVGVIVGAALLARAGIDAPVTVVELAGPTPEVAGLIEDARTSADRVGLLVIAEGSAGRGPQSPGVGSPEAEMLDAAIAAALAAGDPAALAAAATVDPTEATRMLFTSGPALLALAELTHAEPPQRAGLLLDQAVLGVGYLVAAWCWKE